MPVLSALNQAWFGRFTDAEAARAVARQAQQEFPAQAGVLLARLNWQIGHYVSAGQLALASLDQLRDHEPGLWLGRNLGTLGALALDLGREDEALDLFQQQLTLAHRLDSAELEAAATFNLGHCQLRGHGPSARFYLDRAARLMADLESPLGLALVYRDLAQLDQDEGRLGSAQRHQEAALATLGQADVPVIEAGVRGALAETLARRGDQTGAQVQEAALVRLRQAYPGRLTVQLATALPLARRADAPARVVELLEPLLEALAPLGLHSALAELYERLGDAHSALGDSVRASRYLRSALHIERQVLASRLGQQVYRQDMSRRLMSLEKIAHDERRRNEQLQSQVHQLQRLNVRIQHLSRTDSLTRLANRSYLFEVGEAMVQAASAAHPLAVAVIDIDRFKSINDTFGHLIGDQVLARLASLLRQVAQPEDVTARYGGEEFVILRPDADAEALRHTGETLQALVAGAPWAELMPGLQVSVSLGTAHTDDDLQEALHVADQRMYAAKRALHGPSASRE